MTSILTVGDRHAHCAADSSFSLVSAPPRSSRSSRIPASMF
jgi:hypothetical protein